MATRRTTQRQFLLRPDPRTNNDIIYCIAIAAMRHKIDVVAFKALSDHLHQLVFDRYGNVPSYLRDLHGMLAKVLNARFGRFENLWSSAKPSLVRVETKEAFIDELVYVITNAVRHGLVERPEDWPGASGYQALVTGKVLKATKPKSFFSKRNKKLPDKVELQLRIPPEIGDHESIIKVVIPRVTAAVHYYATQRGDRPVVGRTAVLRTPRTATAMNVATHFKLNPTIATKDTEIRLAAIQRKRDFQKEYRIAFRAYRTGTPIPFPAGTYLLVRHLGVAVKPPENLR
jgi:REP element-mobilizing transposase RayT